MEKIQKTEKTIRRFFNASSRKHPIAFSFILLALLFLASCSKKEEMPIPAFTAATVSSTDSSQNTGIGREILYQAAQLVFAPIQQEIG